MHPLLCSSYGFTTSFRPHIQTTNMISTHISLNGRKDAFLDSTRHRSICVFLQETPCNLVDANLSESKYNFSDPFALLRLTGMCSNNMLWMHFTVCDGKLGTLHAKYQLN
jgi:hypothetical protein